MQDPDELSALREPEDALVRLRRETTLAVVMADEQGVVIHANAPFEELFGWTREEIVGMPVTTIIPQRLRAAHHLGFSRFLMTSETVILGRPIELAAIRKDGTEFRAEHFITASRAGGHWVFGATIRPLSEDSVREGKRSNG